MKLRGKKYCACGEGWGMGFLFVFFPEDPNKSQNFNPFSSSLLHRAQSTISICLLLLFATFLLFTLSTLPSSASSSRRLYRRQLLQHPNQRFDYSAPVFSNLSHALQKMGTLYRRGTRAMNDVVVAHVPDTLTPLELKVFVRLFYRSTLASRSDLVFVFPKKLGDFDEVIIRESELFVKLLDQYNNSESSQGFEARHFLKKYSEIVEPIWGRRSGKSNSSEDGESASESPTSYGSVVSFDTDELDPENSLSAFLDHVPPMSLRRWACYPMLLGRLRRKFKHVMLVDANEMLVVGDPLARARSLGPESVLTTQSTPGKHGRRGVGAGHRAVYPGMILGGSRGIRRLSNEMLTAIVRASMQQPRKKKNPITESGLLSQLVGNELLLKNVNVVRDSESVTELGSLSEWGGKSGLKNYSVVRRGNGKLDDNYLVIKYLCSFAIEIRVYSDC